MIYDLWDVESGNIVNTYETEREALVVVRQLLELNGREYARVLSLGFENDDGSMGVVAEGEQLAARAQVALTPELAPPPSDAA
jgi:hypothetical protein